MSASLLHDPAFWLLVLFLFPLLLRVPIAIALGLSALIVATVHALIMIFTPQETMDQTFNALTAQLAGQLDSNSLAMMDSFKENMPTLTFFSELIYCFVFGLILSLIVSKSIPSRNPFDVQEEDATPEEEDEQ